ncbi:ABC transporter [Sphaerisporangium rufum]|uniref:ABC transporter n=1 Tax=Sphaerisporangium rufum TaxID=1381558 RepID=A0A919R2H5_9ACTN|nr:ABC transporter ATP-binding protein [Sphaerisporangium rufum]GII78123.1 ABC transporter [Sphaerisporangium rufum]
MNVTERPPRGGPRRVTVVLDAVTKVYGRGEGQVRALDQVSLGLPEGSFTAVMGPSGSGKSTLMHCAAGLDAPTSGQVTLVGRPLAGLSEDALTELRRDQVAFVFQSYNLVPTLTVTQNVALPMILSGRAPDLRRVEQAIARVGLAERAAHHPGQLSGGQQQRVALARAIATGAAVLFADEPTGALDTVTAAHILGLLRAAARDTGQTIMMTTHDPVAASYADQAVFLVDGRIADRIEHPTAEAVAGRLTRLAPPRLAVR